MAKFTQRIGEYSSIIPSGFAGYLVKNSNIIIDKAYVEKGTTLINAFDNTNALLRDCGSPEPTLNSVDTQYQLLNQKLKNQNDQILLPFWVHYNIGRTTNQAFGAPAAWGDLYLQNQLISPIQDIITYRNQLLSTSMVQEDTKPSGYVLYKNLIQTRVLNSQDLDSKDIPYTTSGLYYLNNVNNSIKAVYPLNLSYKLNNDNPKLVLNLKQRSFIDIFNTVSSLVSSDVSNEMIVSTYLSPVKVYDVYKYDKYDQLILSDKTRRKTTDEITDGSIEKNIHKYVAKSSLSTPKFKDGTDSESWFKVETRDNSYVLFYDNVSDSSISARYLMGPYIYNKNSSDTTIAYKASFGFIGLQKYVNADKDLTFYFKYGTTTYSLHQFINGYLNNKKILNLKNSDQQYTLYANYLSGRLSQNRSLSAQGFLPTLNSFNNYFNVDTIKIENTKEYHPRQLSQTCYFLGFNNRLNPNEIASNIILYYDYACLKPVQIDKSNDNCYLYDHSNGIKKTILSETTNVNGNFQYTFERIKDFQYQYTQVYQNQIARDWYNINSYINYDALAYRSAANYQLNMRWLPGGDIDFEITLNQDHYFTNQYFIDSQQSLSGSGKTKLDRYNYKGGAQLVLSTLSSTASNNALSTLFINDSNDKYKYKMFSFNFKIPYDGWKYLNRKMYAQNPYFKSSVLYNQESGLIDSQTTPLSSLKFSQLQTNLFNGVFSFLYCVLDNKVVQQVVGTGNYGDGGYVDANGIYHTGAKISSNEQKGGTAEKSFYKAYNTKLIKLPFVAKLTKLDSKYDQLNVTSKNDSFNFSIPISTTETIANKQVRGLFFETYVNGIKHNIILQKVIFTVQISRSSSNCNIKLFANIYNGSKDLFTQKYVNAICEGDPAFTGLKTKARVYDFFSSFAPNKQLDQNNFPYTFIPSFSLYCGTGIPSSSLQTDKIEGSTLNSVYHLSTNTVMGTSGEWDVISGFVTDDQSVTTTNLKGDKGTGDTAGSHILDAQPYVMPFDMSTNLFYYKGSSDNGQLNKYEITNDDEVIIINAKKMYSEINESDTKPVGGTLSLSMEDTYDQPIILTSLIRGSQADILSYFKEVNMFVDNNLKYSQKIENLVSGTARKCRYTDAHSQGLQWDLFRLTDGIVFSTSDYNIPLKPYSNSLSTDTQVINFKGKINITFEDLIFQRQCRTGVAFDNINGISFDQRIFDAEVFGLTGNLSQYVTNKKFTGEAKEIADRFGLLGVSNGYHASNITDGGMVPSAVINGQVSNTTNYVMIKRSVDDLSSAINSFGGAQYYNDYYNMKINVNAANKWKTYSQKTKLSKFLIYPDYVPGDHVVGQPYLNSKGNVILNEHIEGGTGTGGQGIVSSFYSTASLVKIAKDIAYVDTVNGVSDLSSFTTFTTAYTMRNKITDVTTDLNGDIKRMNVSITGYFENVSFNDFLMNHGMQYFDIGNDGTYLSGLSGETSQFGVYFNGLQGDLDVYFDTKQDVKQFTFVKAGQPSGNYNILCVDKNQFIHLSNQNDVPVFYGTISFQLSDTEKRQNEMIQIHNFKMNLPKIKSFSIDYTVDQLKNLTIDGYYTIGNNIWQKNIILNRTNGNPFSLLNGQNLQLFSTSQPGFEISGNSTVLTDDGGIITGLLLTVSIPGFKKFKSASTKYFLENKKAVTIQTEDQLRAYNQLYGVKNDKGKYLLDIDYYNPSASIGSQVLTGTITNAYNYITTQPLSTVYCGVAELKYVYNPVDDDKFQIQIITKGKNSPYSKTIYYVNKDVDRWYNLSLYRSIMTSTNGVQTSFKIYFVLNDVNQTNMSDITSKGERIFNCYTANTSFLDGISVKCDLGYGNNLSNWRNVLFPTSTGVPASGSCQSMMNMWKSLYDIEFDKGMRITYNCKYSDDPVSMAYSNTNLQEQYLKDTRRNKDLYQISEIFSTPVLKDFKNTNSNIRLFANSQLLSAFNLGSSYLDCDYSVSANTPSFYNLALSSENCDINMYTDILTDQLRGNLSGNSELQLLRDRLIRYYPRRIMFNDSVENFILKERSWENMHPHISPVGIMAKNIMFISTPQLGFNNPDYTVNYYISGGVPSSAPVSGQPELSAYYEKSGYNNSYAESLQMIKDYVKFFENPQHRLPPVSYQTKLLDSDYATLVYNSCEKYDGVQEITSDETKDMVIYNYSNDPYLVSYTWGNSQISRVESVQDGSSYNTKLAWNKFAFNEYISEVGSVYNFTDSQHVTNVISIETGSINERQCVLMPVISNPLEYQKRSDQSGLVKIVDSIIATAALGYNQLGYPKNGILSYNTNGSVLIDSTNTNYIYVQQDGNSTACTVGATIQKPVYVQSVQQNIQSCSQGFEFSKDPLASIIAYNKFKGDTGIEKISYKQQMTQASTSANILFYIGSSNDANVTNIFLDNNMLYQTTSDLINGDQDVTQLYVYQFNDQSIQYYKDIYTDDYSQKHMYFGNAYTLPGAKSSTSKTTIGDNQTILSGTPNYNVFNVFYNQKNIQMLNSRLSGTDVNKQLITVNCFGYDGLPMKLSNGLPGISGLNGQVFANITNYNNKNANLGKVIGEDEAAQILPIAPTFGMIWSDIKKIDRLSDPNYLIYMNQQIPSGLINTTKVNIIYNQYMGANISKIRFKISQDNFKHAPILIKISFLKYNPGNVGQEFYWYNNSSLNFDIRDTYQSVYNYDIAGDRYVQKVFIDDGTGITKNVYGVKFTIQQIVPQTETYNSCVIDNIQILASNYLNEFGLARAVEDVYVRKCDANYADAYQVKCSEYTWRLPNSRSEWQAVSSILQNDETWAVANAKEAINQFLNPITTNAVSGILASAYFDSCQFSRINTYYIAASQNFNTTISQVLSDNYLLDSDISISWKYIDYVYIYYSCYSFNAKQLLDFYFGDKIYEAVRAKLLNNISNMNGNSAFGNKYTFGGGIAVQKQFELNTQTNNQVFQWKSDIRYDRLDTYQDSYQTDWTQVDQYKRDVYQTSVYAAGHGYGGSLNNVKATGVKVAGWTSYGETTVDTTVTNTTSYTGTTQIGSSTTRNYLGSTLQNSKYVSVDNWTKSFSPRQIKFKIN